ATQGVFIRFVQYLCVLFRQPKELWGKSCYPIRVALFYSAPKVAHYVVFACTRCDAQNTPPVRLKLRLLPTLSLTSSLRLALLLPLRSSLLRRCSSSLRPSPWRSRSACCFLSASLFFSSWRSRSSDSISFCSARRRHSACSACCCLSASRSSSS